MRCNKEVFSRLKKGDFVVVIAVVAVSVFLFVSSLFSSGELRAEIYLDGELYRVIDLYELDGSEEIYVGGCRLLAEKDGIAFTSSQCEDKLCVNRGRLTRSGDTMACVPERVSVVLKGEREDVDAIVF